MLFSAIRRAVLLATTALIAPPGAEPPPPTPPSEQVTDGLVAHLSAAAAPDVGAWYWPNILAGVPATKNVSAYPFNLRDEDGGGTPARTRQSADVVDPLGNTESTKFDFAASSAGQLWTESVGVTLAAANWKQRIHVKAPAGGVGESYSLGAINSQRTVFTAPADWTPWINTTAAYTGTPSIGIYKNGAPVVAPATLYAYCQQFYHPDDVAGGWPTPATERTALQAMHGKRAYAYAGSAPKGPNGGLLLAGGVEAGFIVPHRTAPQAETLPEFTWTVFFSATGIGSGDSRGNIVAADHENSGDVNSRAGLAQVCLDPSGDLNANPSMAYQADTTAAWKLFGEGLTSVTFAYKNGDLAVFVNGVLTSWSGGNTAPGILPRAWRLFSYLTNSTRARQANERIVGEGFDAFFWPRRLTNDEVISHTRWAEAEILKPESPYTVAAPTRRLLLIGGGDSLTAFSNAGTRSWFWQLKDDRASLPYNLPMICEAIGGSAMYPTPGGQTQTNCWRDPLPGNPGYLGPGIGRFTRMLRRVQAAVAMGYTPLVTFAPLGANDFDSIKLENGITKFLYGMGAGYPVGGFYDYAQILRDAGALVDVGTMLRTPNVTEVLRAQFNAAIEALDGTGFDQVIPTGDHLINEDANYNGTYWNMFSGAPTVHYADAGGLALKNDLLKPAIIARMNAA